MTHKKKSFRSYTSSEKLKFSRGTLSHLVFTIGSDVVLNESFLCYSTAEYETIFIRYINAAGAKLCTK